MTRTGHPRISALVVSLALFIVTVVMSPAWGAPADPLEPMGVLRPAEPVVAPDPPFRSLDGREVRLSALRGKVVLLGFFTTW